MKTLLLLCFFSSSLICVAEKTDFLFSSTKQEVDLILRDGDAVGKDKAIEVKGDVNATTRVLYKDVGAYDILALFKESGCNGLVIGKSKGKNFAYGEIFHCLYLFSNTIEWNEVTLEESGGKTRQFYIHKSKNKEGKLIWPTLMATLSNKRFLTIYHPSMLPVFDTLDGPEDIKFNILQKALSEIEPQE